VYPGRLHTASCHLAKFKLDFRKLNPYLERFMSYVFLFIKGVVFQFYYYEEIQTYFVSILL
jgi:hypothetical protein